MWQRGIPGRGMDRPYFKVRGAPQSGYLRVALLNNDLYFGQAHFDRKIRKSYPCTGPTCACWGEGIGSRRKGYAAALNLDSKETFVLELTPNAINELVSLIHGLDSLRGLKFIVERKTKKDGTQSRQGKVTIRNAVLMQEISIPPAFDVEPHLRALWGFLPGENGLAEGEIAELTNDIGDQFTSVSPECDQ